MQQLHVPLFDEHSFIIKIHKQKNTHSIYQHGRVDQTRLPGMKAHVVVLGLDHQEQDAGEDAQQVGEGLLIF